MFSRHVHKVTPSGARQIRAPGVGSVVAACPGRVLARCTATDVDTEPDQPRPSGSTGHGA